MTFEKNLFFLLKSSLITFAASCRQQTGPGVTEKSFANQISDVLTSKGANVIDFDWSNPVGFTKAVTGCKTIFCTIPHMDGWADVFPEFVSTCKKLKIEHFVKISFLRKSETAEMYKMNVPFCKFHSTCDDMLEKSKLYSRMSYTILACSHLMSTPLLHQGRLLAEEHKFVTASYGMGVNYVSPNDVADAAMVVLFNLKDHRNKTYNLTGRRAVKDSEVAKLLSKKYGTEIQHVQLGYHDYTNDVKARGLPSWLVKDSAEFERMKASGIDELASSYKKDLEILIGRKPETFDEYLDSTSTMRPGMKFNLPKTQ